MSACEAIEIVRGDITELDVDVIVNAANPSLLGGGGVDGAIHRRAGPGLLAECRGLGGAHTGEVKLTRGHELRARAVAHAVGPVWKGGDAGESELLASCYRRALELVDEHGFGSIAFPSISTGAYGYPIEQACRIALRTARDFMERRAWDALPIRLTFCCFSAADEATYRRAAEELLG